jgi:cell division septum initiation protein DivIVA
VADDSEAKPLTHVLPVVRRGYERDAADALFDEIEGRLTAALAERDGAAARVAELEKELAEANARKHAVVEALALASRVRSESERDAMDAKEQSMRKAEALQSESKLQADEIVQAAEADAERILEEARAKSGNLEHELRGAEQLAEQTQAQLTAFLRSLRRSGDEDSDDGVRGTPGDRPSTAPRL